MALMLQGSGLPSLMQSRLHAPRILKMTKVATYVAQKLESEQLYYTPHEFYYKPAWQMMEVCSLNRSLSRYFAAT